MEQRGRRAKNVDSGDTSPLCSASNVDSLGKAWGNALIPAVPGNLGCISFTAIRTIHSGTIPVLASSPSSSGFPVPLPLLRKTALQCSARLPLPQVPPNSLPFSGQGGGVVSPLLFL